MAEREAAKAAEEIRRLKEQEEKQKAVMEEFHKPPDRTPEQLMQLVMQLVDRAAEHGAERSSGLSLSEQPLHRSWAKDKQFGARLGPDFGGPSLAPVTNSGAITFGRSDSVSGLRSWSTRVGCLAI